MRHRVIFRRALVATLLLVSAASTAWAVACHRLEQGILDAVATARQEGWSLAAEHTAWAGWPFSAAIDLDTVTLSGSAVPGLIWQAQTARIDINALHPMTLEVQVRGPQSLEAQGVPPIPFTVSHFLIRADLRGDLPPHVSLAHVESRLPAGPLALQTAELDLLPDGVIADLAGLSLPGVATAIGAIHLAASVDPALPVGASPEASARAWRQAGGHIDISQATLHWNTLDAAGSGRITLDDRLQPQADGTLQASGLPRLLDDLAKAGALAPAQASAANAVLTVLAAPSGGQRVALPVSLADGVLRLARFPLLRFPPLAWN